MKVIADSAIPFLVGVLDRCVDVSYIAGIDIAAEDVVDADVLIVRTRTKCNAELLDGSSVRVIATATIGFDHIDLDYCRGRGIRVISAAGCNARGVLQWVGAALVHFSKVQGWQPKERTIGVVGVGHVGSLICEYGRMWGFNVVCCDPPREMVEHLGFGTLAEVAEVADIITFHTPLTELTRGVVNESLLKSLSGDAIIFNSSRGDVVVGRDILKSGLKYALDVWEGEPNINLDVLAGATLATSHIAGYSLQGKANASSMVVNSLSKLFGWGLDDWYPEGVEPSVANRISWSELCGSVEGYCDLEAESGYFKSHPGDFERVRDNYIYREEYF